MTINQHWHPKRSFTQCLERVELEQMQAYITSATGLATMIVDPGGRPLTYKTTPPALCRLLNSTVEGKVTCGTFRLELVRATMASGQLKVRYCQAGLVNLTIPLQAQGKTVAVLLGGSIAVNWVPVEQVKSLAAELGINPAELLKAAGEVPVWSQQRFDNAIELFCILGGLLAHVVQFGRMLMHLLEVRQMIASELSEAAVLEQTVQGASEVMGTPICLLRFYDREETNSLEAVAVWGIDSKVLKQIKYLPLVGSIAGKTFETGQPVKINDLSKSDLLMLLPGQEQQVCSALVVPVQTRQGIMGTLAVYDFCLRQWSNAEVGYLASIADRVGLAVENARVHQMLQEHHLSTVAALVAALEAKDVYTEGHSKRVANLAKVCAWQLGATDEEQDEIYLAGLLHDVGKIGVSERVLLKDGPLTIAEREEIQKHTVTGADILAPAKLSQRIIEAVYHHHEDYDGSGYPDGLTGEEIPLWAQIIRVADTYDAMTSRRHYRPAFTANVAVQELERWAGRQFSPAVVTAFLRGIKQGDRGN